MSTPTPNPEIDVDQLFLRAEIRAERLVALLRMAIAIGLGLSFVLTVWPQVGDPQPTPVLIRQWIYASGTMLAYFTLGLVSWLANQRGLYRPWMAWPAATADCLFVLVGVGLSLVNISVPGSHVFVFPSIWLAPLVLTFGALRFNPWLQAYITLVIVLGVFALLQVSSADAQAPRAQSIALFFSGPPNYMRLAMLGLAGLILVVATARTRAVLLTSLTEARNSINLTRYLPGQLAPRLAEGGLAELQRGSRQQMGVLFIDMRGFTNWSQHRSPQEIIEFMTEYRRRISNVARETGGMIDKFMGDAAMIVFESHGEARATARACVDCAEKLDREISGWSRARVAAGADAVQAGIGLHWGEVFSGVVGDQDRLEFSVFGDTVNTAARLEEMTKTLGVDIVASRDILTKAGFGPAPEGWAELAEVSVRGRTGTVEILGRTVS